MTTPRKSIKLCLKVLWYKLLLYNLRVVYRGNKPNATKVCTVINDDPEQFIKIMDIFVTMHKHLHYKITETYTGYLFNVILNDFLVDELLYKEATELVYSKNLKADTYRKLLERDLGKSGEKIIRRRLSKEEYEKFQTWLKT